MRAGLLVAIVLLAGAPAPSAAAEDEPFQIPLPRAGDAILLSNGLGHRWDAGVFEVADAFGVTRSAYRVQGLDRSGGPSESSEFVEVSRESVVARTTTTSSGKVWVNGVLFARTTEWDEERGDILNLGPFGPHLHAFAGRSLRIGDTVAVPSPPPVRGPQEADALWQVTGFTPDGLLVVDLLTSDATAYFASDFSWPVKTRVRFGALDFWSNATEITRGTGPFLADEDYTTPAFLSSRPALQTMLTLDGPAEAMNEAFPLQDAVAFVREHSTTRSFFAADPQAFLIFAKTRNDPIDDVSTWHLQYGSNATRKTLDVELERSDERTRVMWTSLTPRSRDLPPAATLVGTPVACYGAAVAAALATGIEPMMNGRRGASYSANYFPGPSVTCEADFEVLDPGVAVQPAPLVGGQGVAASQGWRGVAVEGVKGAWVRVLDGEHLRGRGAALA